MGHPVRSGPILRWRVLAGARASTRLRMASYPIAFSPLPLLVLASFEPSFPFVRTVWAGLVAMHFSMVIFGVEFMARHAAVDRLYELDERGIRLGQGPRSIGNVPWRTVRSVRVRIRGREEGRGAFVLRAGLRIVALPVDESQIPGLADRVAAAVARLAP